MAVILKFIFVASKLARKMVGRGRSKNNKEHPKFFGIFLCFSSKVQMRVRKCENRYGLCVSVCEKAVEGEVEAVREAC